MGMEVGLETWHEMDSDRVYRLAERGIQWNVSIPTGLSGSVNAILSDRIIGTNTPGALNIGIENSNRNVGYKPETRTRRNITVATNLATTSRRSLQFGFGGCKC